MSIRARPSAEPSHTRMHSYEVASSAAVSDARVRESKVDRLLSTVASRIVKLKVKDKIFHRNISRPDPPLSSAVTCSLG